MDTAGRIAVGSRRLARRLGCTALTALVCGAIVSCASTQGTGPGSSGTSGALHVPHEGQWGIYSLDLTTQQTRLVYGSPDEINGSALRLNAAGDTLAFARKIGGSTDASYEISTVRTDGTGLTRLTDNDAMDVYPTWSPDGSRIVFLSMPGPTMQILLANADGSNVSLLYNPGAGQQAGDPHWVGHTIAFTRASAIWTMTDEGKGASQITHPPNAGVWGTAPLPGGDYDPRMSPDGGKIVFERLVDTASQNGGYDLFVVNVDGSAEKRLTETGWAQGLATYSNAGTEILWTVAAIEGQGKYRMYAMGTDGTNARDITPTYYPAAFLCHAATYSQDDQSVYFIGQWWQ